MCKADMIQRIWACPDRHNEDLALFEELFSPAAVSIRSVPVRKWSLASTDIDGQRFEAEGKTSFIALKRLMLKLAEAT